MGFNYGLERKKFDEQWTKNEKWYRECGMSEEAILSMHEFDLDVFNQRRAVENHTDYSLSDYISMGVLNEENASASFYRFFEQISITDDPMAKSSRTAWLDEIEDESLYRKICALKPIELEILTELAIEGMSFDEIADFHGMGKTTIWYYKEQIKKKLA